MRKLALFAVAAMAAMSVIPAHAASDFVKTGTILVGDPAYAVSSVTPCDGSVPTNGVDGEIIPLPDGSVGHDITASATDATGLADIDVRFIDATCSNYLDYNLENVGNESGVVPDGAAYVEVDLYTGVKADYTLTVSGVLP